MVIFYWFILFIFNDIGRVEVHHSVYFVCRCYKDKQTYYNEQVNAPGKSADTADWRTFGHINDQ